MILDLAIISWTDTKTQATNENIDKLEFAQIKNLRASKGTLNRVKRQPTF